MIEDKELKTGSVYRVRITEHEDDRYRGATVIVKWEGLYMRSLETRKMLFLSQCEVLEEVNDKGDQ